MFYSFVQKICAAFFAKFGIHMAVFSGGIVGRCFPLCTLTILYQQRGSHRRLGNAHGARDDLVEASCVSFASVQARKLNHYAASPLPTKLSGFAGSPRRASEKRTVGSPICLDTQCPACTQDRLPWLGLKAVETPSTSCESCQALSALFPIAGARAANTAETISKEWRVYVRKQKILLHEAQGKFLHQ